MKNSFRALIPFLVICCSCIPESWPLPTFSTTKIVFKGDLANIEKVDVTVKDINCVSGRPCKTDTFSLDKNTILTGLNIIPGDKVITIRESKGGKIIGQFSTNEGAVLGQDLVIDLAKQVIVSSPAPDAVSSSVPTSLATPGPSNSTSGGATTAPNTTTGTTTPSVIPSQVSIPTGSPTAKISTNSGGSGSGASNVNSDTPSTVPTVAPTATPTTVPTSLPTPSPQPTNNTPVIQVSASVVPDNTGVK